MRAGLLFFIALIIIGHVASARESNKIPAEAKRALENPSSMVLVSIDPVLIQPTLFNRLTERISHRHFHGWPMLGETPIADRATQKKIASAIEAGVQNFNGWMAACFNPRHGVRVTSGSVEYDFVICYECNQTYIYAGDRKLAGLGGSGSSSSLDASLRTAHIKQAKAD